MSVKALITPAVLKWARESSKMMVEDVSKKVPCSTEKLIKWELGDAQPTFSQAEKLAKIYKRPLAVFFLPDIPSGFQLLQDFRTKNAKEFSTALIFMIREIQQKQRWLKSYLIENNEEKLDFFGKFSLDDSPEKIAQDIRSVLEIDSIDFANVDPLKSWIYKVESKRIFVSLSSNYHNRLKIDSNEYKGFVITDNYAPFIFINSDEWDSAQIFTLVHELAHLWIGKTGVSNEIEINLRESNLSEYNPVEIFCNKVTANTLLPYDSFLKIWNETKPEVHSDLKNISKVFGVSSLTTLIRAYNLDLLSKTLFNEWKSTLEKEFSIFYKNYLEKEKKKKEEKKGGPNYYRILLRRNGIGFSQVVLDSYKGGYLKGVEVSNLLNLKLNKISNYEKLLYF